MIDRTARAARLTDRAQAQRDRILCAAQRCFIEHGFHAASMANIADAAQMSVGLIYRYFENKNAIILAIIERQLLEQRASIASLHTDPDLRREITDLFTAWRQGDPSVMNPVLFLEMRAEATRDPQIAQALADADRIAGADFHAWLRKEAESQGKSPTQQDLEARAFALYCIIEGLAIRSLREQALAPDVLAATLDLLLPLLTFRDR